MRLSWVSNIQAVMFLSYSSLYTGLGTLGREAM